MNEPIESLTAYLVDDEPLALKRLHKLLTATGKVRVLGRNTDPREAVTYLKAHRVDVLFLDIQMPERNGFQLLAELREPPLVIFTTAYDRYALQAFKVNSIDYLLKPVVEEQLDRALAKIERLSETATAMRVRKQIQTLAATLANPPRSDDPLSSRITFRLGDKVVLEDLKHITHFWAEDKVTFAATDQGTKYITDFSIADLEGKLGARGFTRIHRATLVNLAFVSEIHRWFGSRMLISLKDATKTKLHVSRSQARLLRQRLGL